MFDYEGLKLHSARCESELEAKTTPRFSCASVHIKDLRYV